MHSALSPLSHISGCSKHAEKCTGMASEAAVDNAAIVGDKLQDMDGTKAQLQQAAEGK